MRKAVFGIGLFLLIIVAGMIESLPFWVSGLLVIVGGFCTLAAVAAAENR